MRAKETVYNWSRQPTERFESIADKRFRCGHCREWKKVGTTTICYIVVETGRTLARFCSKACEEGYQRDLRRRPLGLYTPLNNMRGCL